VTIVSSPFRGQKSKNFLGRGLCTAPSPGPTPGGEGDTLSPHPSAPKFGALILGFLFFIFKCWHVCVVPFLMNTCLAWLLISNLSPMNKFCTTAVKMKVEPKLCKISFSRCFVTKSILGSEYVYTKVMYVFMRTYL